MDDDFDTENPLDVEASDFLAAEIPSKLWDKVDGVFTQIMFAQVERKFSGKWRTLKKRIRFGPKGPPASTTIESLCTQLIEWTQEDTASRGEDGDYRALLTVKDGETPKGYRRLTCPIQTEIGADGSVTVSDADDSGGETHKMFLSLFQQQSIRMDAVFDRSLQMMDKNIEIVDKVGDLAEKNARSLSETGRGMNNVMNAATNAMEKAAKLITSHQDEAAVVQLAKLDQQLELQKLGAVTALLAKVGGPLGQQIVSSIIGKKDNPQQGRTSAALAASGQQPQQAQQPQQDGEPEQSPPIGSPPPQGLCTRLKQWVSDLSDNHKTGLKEIIGQKHYEAFLTAAMSGDDAQAWETACNFKIDFDKRSEVNQAEIYGKLVQITTLLGEDLASRFGALLPSTPETPEAS